MPHRFARVSTDKDAPTRRFARVAMVAAAILAAAAATGWMAAAHFICTGCNRIGNYLDEWYQRELLCAVDGCVDASASTDLWAQLCTELLEYGHEDGAMT